VPLSSGPYRQTRSLPFPSHPDDESGQKFLHALNRRHCPLLFLASAGLAVRRDRSRPGPDSSVSLLSDQARDEKRPRHAMLASVLAFSMS
jgi:hypothetical protein